MRTFTLVSTVFNEIKRLDQTIADLEAQTLKPDEIILADAGSRDGTLERLERWQRESSMNIVVIVLQGCNIAEGRNEAIRRASHELIVSTDFGCRYRPEWLASLVKPFENPDVMVVGGAFSILKDEVKTAAAKADFVLQNGYPVVMDEHFSVSSRSVAYLRRVWEAIGGYPEWLTLAADDTIFWRQIKQRRFRYVLAEDANVFWLRHKTFRAFAKEAYRYGLGDGESLINFRNLWSHLAETWLRAGFYLMLISLPLILVSGHFWLALLLIPLSTGLRSYKNAWRNWKGMHFGWKVLLHSFYLIELSRYEYLKGYFSGWLFSGKAVKEGRKNLSDIR